jgi:hypothetical protein
MYIRPGEECTTRVSFGRMAPKFYFFRGKAKAVYTLCNSIVGIRNRRHSHTQANLYPGVIDAAITKLHESCSIHPTSPHFSTILLGSLPETQLTSSTSINPSLQYFTVHIRPYLPFQPLFKSFRNHVSFLPRQSSPHHRRWLGNRVRYNLHSTLPPNTTLIVSQLQPCNSDKAVSTGRFCLLMRRKLRQPRNDRQSLPNQAIPSRRRRCILGTRSQEVRRNNTRKVWQARPCVQLRGHQPYQYTARRDNR